MSERQRMAATTGAEDADRQRRVDFIDHTLYGTFTFELCCVKYCPYRTSHYFTPEL